MVVIIVWVLGCISSRFVFILVFVIVNLFFKCVLYGIFIFLVNVEINFKFLVLVFKVIFFSCSRLFVRWVSFFRVNNFNVLGSLVVSVVSFSLFKLLLIFVWMCKGLEGYCWINFLFIFFMNFIIFGFFILVISCVDIKFLFLKFKVF